jgi:hypothetical protein
MMQAGIDDIISLVPIYGDIASGVLQLYQVFLCFMFGVPRQTLMLMVCASLVPALLGITPIATVYISTNRRRSSRDIDAPSSYLPFEPYH